MSDGRGYWLAYYSDWSGFVAFANEIEALRHAVGKSMDVAYIEWGEDPREATNRKADRS